VSSSVQLHEDSWHLLSVLDQAPGLHALADTLADLVDEGLPIVACTADLKYSNGLIGFEQRHPERFLQFGVSEQNMVTASAGLASCGELPYVATFASFLALLCCEQIRTDIAYPGLPVRLIGHHAGIALGFYGTSHHATEDIAIMRSIAGMTVIAPADSVELAAALRATANHPGPIYIRIGRGREPRVYEPGTTFTLGSARTHCAGEELTVLATGSTVHPAAAAVKELRACGRDVGLIAVPTLKPFDRESVLAAASNTKRLLTVEEHNVIGGLGAAVAEALAQGQVATPLTCHGIPDEYSLIGPPTHLYRHYRLDADGIEAIAQGML
jgi:transketolase